MRAPSTDLAVTNVDSADPLLAGQPLTYTVTVTNHGPDDAPGVTLTDQLPGGMAYGAPSASQGTCTRVGSIVTCLLGPLANGATATVTLPMVPTVAMTASTTASALPTGGAVDPAQADNRATQSTTVRAPSADLAVANTDSVDPLLTGQPLTYTVTVANRGPDDAPAVTLNDQLPAGMAYGVPAPSQGACTRSGAAVTCLLGPLASGATATVTFPVVPLAAGTASNGATATVGGGAVDPVSGNNAAYQSTTVRASSSDLAASASASPDPATVGQPLTFTLNVTNNGPDDAPAVTLTDTLPGSMAYGAVAASQGSCVRSASTVTCQLGPLPVGATAQVTLTMTPTAASTATNSATIAVAGGGTDPVAGNNRTARSVVVH